MDGDVSGLFVRVNEIANEAVAVAVEVDADQFAGPVEHGAAAVAADRVGSADEIERRFQIQFRLRIEPAFREFERFAIPERFGSCERSANRRMKWQIGAADAIPTRAAISDSQGKRRIGGDVLSESSEARLGEFRIRLAFRFFDGFFESFPEISGVTVDRSSESNHRIRTGFDGRFTAVEEFLPRVWLGKCRPFDEPIRSCGGVHSAEGNLDPVRFRSELFACESQCGRKFDSFQILVYRRRREELLLERFQIRIAIFPQALAGRFWQFLGKAHELPGHGEQVGRKSVARFEEHVFRFEFGELRLNVGDNLVGFRCIGRRLLEECRFARQFLFENFWR